jgi:hypothetical protein
VAEGRGAKAARERQEQRRKLVAPTRASRARNETNGHWLLLPRLEPKWLRIC